jgi:hypothetical protein
MKLIAQYRSHLLGVIAVGILIIFVAHPLIIFLDNRFFCERIRGFYGKYLAEENWESAPRIPDGMNYMWLDSKEGMLRIGHALGSSGTKMANQLWALPAARLANLHLLEVDLWLDVLGNVRCFHGPGDPGAITPESCTFDRLLRATQASGEYIVLDIKTDFTETSAAVTRVLDQQPEARHRTIYQLYRPDDVKVFKNLPNVNEYAGPIMTAYASRSSLSDFIEGARHIGIRAVTFPFTRRHALPKKLSGIVFLAHPVHDCETLAASQSAAYDGIYTLSSLICTNQ